MALRVAQIWDEYVIGSFVEVHPIFPRIAPEVKSITITRTLWENGKVPDGTVFAHRILPQPGLLKRSLLFRAKSYLERRFFKGSFLHFARDQLRAHQSQIVHFNFGFTAAQYPDLPGSLPFLVTFYGSDVSAAIKSPYWASRYREVLPRAAALLVLCDEARERLAALGCDREKIHVWNLPAGIERYPLRSRVPEPVPRLLTTARFVEKKGHGLLLDAYSLLAREGVAFQATLLGYGPDKKAIEDSIRNRNLSSCVRVIDTSFQGDFAALHYEQLLAHDIFVLPSIRAANGDDEGGPALTMVCAQAAGLPVVSTRFPGAEITMRQNETGHYADPSAPALAQAIGKLLTERTSWEKMGREGSRLANENFGEATQVKKLVKIYESIMAQ